MFWIAPVVKLSNPRTWAPWANRTRARLDPMKPAIPVTSTFDIVLQWQAQIAWTWVSPVSKMIQSLDLADWLFGRFAREWPLYHSLLPNGKRFLWRPVCKLLRRVLE
jgi:hypothetical protein